MFKLLAVMLLPVMTIICQRPAQPEIFEPGRHQDDGRRFGSKSQGAERGSDHLHRR